MGTTADKLNRVLATKNDLKAALIEKGQDPGDVFSQYPDKVRAIKIDSIKLASIDILRQPHKTSYTAKESFSSVGMGVKAIFSNDAHKTLTDIRMPDGYTQVEYIQSSGTQYIDTGFVPNQDTRVVCKAQYTDTTGNEVIFGSRYSSGKDRFDFLMTGGVFYSAYGSEGGSALAATPHLIEVDKNKNITSVNGTVFSTHTYTTFQCPGNMMLFCCNTNNSINLLASARIYSCQVYDNDILIRNFVPCTVNSTIGMYDLVNNQFYPNAGTGEFVAGPSISPSYYDVPDGVSLTAGQTSVTVAYTEHGVTAEAEVAVSVEAIKLNVPTVSKNPVYTGSTLNPTWSGYDSSLMTISGDTSGTNAGTYTATFALKDKVNYTWADGTTADKSVTWTIGKAQASITLDKSSVVLNSDNLSETVTFSSVGMKSVIVMSSDTSVATVSMDGNVITISSVNETTGTANIIISGDVDSNYNAPEYPSVAVEAKFAIPVTITVTGDGLLYYVEIYHNGTCYYDPATFTANVGDTIECRITECWRSQFIYLNGEKIDGGYSENDISYEYTVVSDTVIDLYHNYQDAKRDRDGKITIIEEGYATISRHSNGCYGNASYCYLMVNGVKYTNITDVSPLVVPVGTVISCYAYAEDCCGKGKYGYCSINVYDANGSSIYSDSGEGEKTYEYTVTGNISISLHQYSESCAGHSGSSGRTGRDASISIYEE